MEKHNIFVYEPTYYEVGLRADEIYEFLLNKGLNVSACHTCTYSDIYTDIIDIRIGHSLEDTCGFIFNEIFDVPRSLRHAFDSYKIDGGVLAPFSGTVYDYLDCLISHVSDTRKGLPTGYFEDMNTILKGGEVREDSGV